MATIALSLVGSALGSAFLPAGISVLGATITGATIGGAVGALAGGFIDSSLFGSSARSTPVQGPRMSDIYLSGSAEGAPIHRVYGRYRVGGQLIWATRLDDNRAMTLEESWASAGKGFGLGDLFGGDDPATPQQEEPVKYYANLAYGLCEGEISGIGRIWADGKEISQSDYLIRVYKGTEDQAADPLIQAKEGTSNAPAYRGLAYVVFESLPLEKFGNRLPQLSFEVLRPVDGFEKKIKAVTVIPASGEWAYEPTEVHRHPAYGITELENIHTNRGLTDWSVAMNQLRDLAPNMQHASLFLAWFGDDLRAGSCQIKPRVELANRVTWPLTWSAAGLTRQTAPVVSTYAGGPAYGSSPADASVVRAIIDLKARGLAVTVCPFILMDVPAGNALPSPYGGASQPAYPWRGRITCHPAAGQPGTVDKTAAAATQVQTFLGTCVPAHFTVSGETVTYTGPAEWGFRRFILHHAALAKAAGGVDTFIIGSEMRGMTWVRSAASTYPFVSALVQLAADVKSMLGTGTKVTYGADWSEYFGHQPGDGTGDVYFHLDPLWSSANIDAIGIDNYWPLADWRDGTSHVDKSLGYDSIYDVDYLKSRLAGGEGFDWFYASDAHRASQTRTTITDGAGKPWVFRYKDIKSWWQSQHYNRPGGVESGSPTAWVPQSKPIWFTEVGCPAIDKGSNQPNVFVDPKSSESFFPYFSRGTRDDLIQRRHLQAFLEYYDPSHEDFFEAANPLSTMYSGRMVDHARIYLYTWDARPYPAFPTASKVWADGPNWELGHWITGRISGAQLAGVVSAMLDDYGFQRYAAGELRGIVDGYAIDRVMSFRDAVGPLELAYTFDSVESGGLVTFRHRGAGGVAAALTADDLLALDGSVDPYHRTRSQETELPVAAKITYVNGAESYGQATVEARRLTARSARVAEAQLPIAMGQDQAMPIVEVWLHDTWIGREKVVFAMPPSMLAIEPSDVCELVDGQTEFKLRITRCRDAYGREMEGFSIDPDAFLGVRAPSRVARQETPSVFGRAIGVFMDLPLLTGQEDDVVGYVASYADPWPASVIFYRSPSQTGYVPNCACTRPATLGVSLTDFHPGCVGRFDRANVVRVVLEAGQLSSALEIDMLRGDNVIAIQNADGEWEVVQYMTATLVADRTYDLSVMLRGQAGTETAMRAPVAAGARVVILNRALVPVSMTRDQVQVPYNWRYGPSNRDIGSFAFLDQVHAFNGRALAPLSPCHVKARGSGGDIEISWVRRTRRGGDSWDQVEVPLAEDSEMYDVDILDGATVKRTLSATTPAVTYTAAMQTADFGATQTSLTLAVYQSSPSYGRGTKKQVTVVVS